MSRIKSILLLTLFLLTVLKQHNFIGGFISNKTPIINEINDEINYSIVVKQSFFDGIFTIFSFGLYTPTTIIVNK